MASLTVRQLDEKVKKLLRLRAARNGRSMEDEIRTILGQAAQAAGREVLEAFNPPSPTVRREPAQRTTDARAGRGRVLLVIGGGIAAYKSLDLIRRLRSTELPEAQRERMHELLRLTIKGVAAGMRTTG